MVSVPTRCILYMPLNWTTISDVQLLILANLPTPILYGSSLEKVRTQHGLQLRVTSRVIRLLRKLSERPVTVDVR